MRKKYHLSGSLVVWVVVLLGAFPPTKSSNASESRQLDHDSAITIEQALSRAIEANQLLAASRTQIGIQSSKARQAGLPPNPRFSYEVENFGGDTEFAGFRSAEQTAKLSQEIELGGKRGKRRNLADRRSRIAVLEHRTALLDLAAEVRSAFYGLLAAQQLDSLARDKVTLAHEVYNTVRKRVEGGKVSPVELSRAEVALSLAGIETGRSSAELVTARQRLAASWGGQQAEFGKAHGQFDLLYQPEELKDSLTVLEANPKLEIAAEQISVMQAEAALARAARFPDLELGGGVKSVREANSTGFVAEISLPLPLFDRNQGEIAAADQGITQAVYRRNNIRTELVLAIASTHAELDAAYREAVVLRDKVLTGSQSVYAATRIGYTEGKFGYLELLDAQRSLFEARGSYIETLKRYHLSRTRLDTLLGREEALLGKLIGEEG